MTNDEARMTNDQTPPASRHVRVRSRLPWCPNSEPPCPHGGFPKRRAAETSLDHLLPHPARGSACKRLMLYLRWMVRNDRVDVGSWSDVSPALLVAPVDTHLFAMARRFNWTQRKQANLATALEITAALRRFAPRDPLRYDFALTRPGIMRLAL